MNRIATSLTLFAALSMSFVGHIPIFACSSGGLGFRPCCQGPSEGPSAAQAMTETRCPHCAATKSLKPNDSESTDCCCEITFQNLSGLISTPPKSKPMAGAIALLSILEIEVRKPAYRALSPWRGPPPIASAGPLFELYQSYRL